ncbi:PEP-CTERM sorting domain-containing protein [Phycisphaeraceae bacterium D3-23]
MRIHTATCTLLTAAAFTAAPGTNAATALHEYLFSGNLNDSLATGGTPSLVANGGSVGSNGYTFGQGQGLSLSNWVPASTDAQQDYTIEFYLQLDVLGNGSYGKLVDFKDRSEDQGLYLRNINGGHRPVLFNVNHDNPPSGDFTQGQFHHVVLSRDEPGTDDLRLWLNGVEQWNLNDGTNEHAVFSRTGNIIHFFQDDSGGENIAGVVDYLRIYDGGASQAEVNAMFNSAPTYGNAELIVNKRTGEITLTSDNPFEAVNMRGYQLTSDVGVFDTNTWDSFDDTNADGGTWSEANPSATQLAELNLTDSASLGSNDSRSLGHAYAGGINGAEDLAFTYLAPGLSEPQTLTVRYIDDVGISGDLNGDGFVGVADLDIILAYWGQTVATGALIHGDAIADGFVNSADLQNVVNNWSNGTPPDTNIPEPGTALALAGLSGLLLRRRRW